MLKNSQRILFFALIYTCFVLYISFADADIYLPEKAFFKNQDKVFHLLIYIFLAIIWGLYALKSRVKKRLWISFITTFIFGIILESIQEIVSPFRTYDTMDLIANCLGVIIGTVIVHYYMKYKVKIN